MKPWLWTIMLAGLCALSACKEEAPVAPGSEAAASGPALIIDGKAVSPMCFINRNWEGDALPVDPLSDCEGEDYIANTDDPPPLPDSFISTGYYMIDDTDPSQHYPGMIGYRYLGEYRNAHAILTMENSGGTGTFTMLQLWREGEDGKLRVAETLAGGDRCNGGIGDAEMKGKSLSFSIALTPYDFLEVADYNPKGLKAYDDLDACAVCCYGYLQFVDERPSAVILEDGALERIATTPESEQTMQSCFDEVFIEAFRARKTALSLREVHDFIEKFHQICAAQ